uniref:Uncharacterized protein n=1 Tax=viral metagenome TaxID=1070528 RepID=A0A6C0HSR9_9ZZZZ
MNWAVTIYSAILFFILTPNILVRLPPKSSKFVVAATHAVIFALIFHFTCKIVWKATSNMFEGFSEGTGPMESTGKMEPATKPKQQTM